MSTRPNPPRAAADAAAPNGAALAHPALWPAPVPAASAPMPAPAPAPAAAAAGPALATALAAWRQRTPRERLALQAAAVVLCVTLLQLLLVGPAWRTLQGAASERTRLDTQWAEMQHLAREAAQWRATPAVTPEQSSAALQAAVARLGAKARLSLQGPRAVVTLQAVSLEELGPWLQELGSGARTRPLAISLNRDAGGYSGSLTLALPGTAP